MRRYLLLLVSFVILSCAPVKKYQNLTEVRSWENDIQEFEKLDKIEIYPEDAILFAGSSSIKIWSTLEKDMAPYHVIQRGYGGAKLSDFAVYAARIFDPHPCKAIVIFIANDITGGEKDKRPQQVAGLFRNVLKTIRKKHPDTPVFWIAITPTASRWQAWPEIQKANNLIKKICDNRKNTYFIPTDFAFLNESGTPKDELFRSDRLHLNEEGYKVWRKIIMKELNKVIPFPDCQIIGHRGESYTAPENTIASAKLAWESGADAVEVDIHLSKDNRIMVCHDANTRRTSGEDFMIKETNSDILRKLDVGSFRDKKYKGEMIPFLEEIILTIPDGKELVIEIKCGIEVLARLKETIGEYGKNKKFSFISFDFHTITETRKVIPGSSCYWLCSDSDMFNRTVNLVPGAGLKGVSLQYSIIDAKVAEQIKTLNLELFAWTVDEPDEAKKLISSGVRGITTNRPGWLREQIYQY